MPIVSIDYHSADQEVDARYLIESYGRNAGVGAPSSSPFFGEFFSVGFDGTSDSRADSPISKLKRDAD